MDREHITLAGIDIGSNAVRLIVKDIKAGDSYKDASIKKTAYLRLPVRLGTDAFLSGEIQAEKEQLLIKAMGVYKQIMEFYNVSDYQVVATSAMRTASNNKEVIERVKAATGVEIRMTDGEEEAALLYEINRCTLDDDKTYLSADLGGGSLQLTLFQAENLIWTHSYKIGTVRLLENVADKAEFELLDKKLEELQKKYGIELKLIGVGGNINKVSSLVGETNVELEDILKLHAELKPMSVKERMNRYGLREDRADVFVPAMEVYINILQKLKLKKILVPKIGLADAVVRKLYEKYF